MAGCCGKKKKRDSDPYGPSCSASQTSCPSDLSSCGGKSGDCEEPVDIYAKRSRSGSCCSLFRSSDGQYVRTLEKEYEALQMAFFSLTSHFAKVQFRLRQIFQAQPSERDRLLGELASVAFCGNDEFAFYELPRMKKDLICLGNIRKRQGHLIKRLRTRMAYLCEHSIPAESLDDVVSVQSKDDKKKKDKKDKKNQKEVEPEKKPEPQFERKHLLPPLVPDDDDEDDDDAASRTSATSKSSKGSKSSKDSKSSKSSKNIKSNSKTGLASKKSESDREGKVKKKAHSKKK